MAESPEDPSGALTFADYVRVLWRWKWLIVVAALVSTLAAFLYSVLQTPQYRANAYLAYTQPFDPTNPLASAGSSSAQDLVLQSAVNVVGTRAIGDSADAILAGASSSEYEISAEIGGGPSAAKSESGFVAISAIGVDPERAAAVANAYAKAVSEWRRTQLLNRTRTALRVLEAELSTYTSAASRRTGDYLTLRQQYQSLLLLEKSVTADVQILVPATAPTEPFAPQPRQAAALGVGVGLLAGLALAFLFDQLSSRVRGRRDAAEALGLRIIGSIPEMPRRWLDQGRLIALKHPGGAAAEALRLVRSNLDYVNVDSASTFLVTSGLAGEGKTTLVCNLAVTMAMAGKEVVVVDGNLRSPRVHEFFDIHNDVGLSSVAAGSAILDAAVQWVELPSPLRGRPNDDGSRPEASAKTSSAGRLAVLTSGPPVPNPGELMASGHLKAIMRRVQEIGTDIVIVDSPALLEASDATAMSSQVEALLLVVRLDKARRTTLREVQGILATLPCTKIGAVLVRTKERRGR